MTKNYNEIIDYINSDFLKPIKQIKLKDFKLTQDFY